MRRLVLLSLLVGVAALVVYAFWIEPRNVVLTRLEVPVVGLQRPIRALVIGDIQPAGPHETPARIGAVIERGMALRPDIVLLLGDYVTTRGLKTAFVDPVDTTAAMAALDAPMGVYSVLGNHDWWWDAPRMETLLTAAGITVLRNRAILVEDGGKALWIAGLEDLWTGNHDLPGTLNQAGTDAPVVLLTHNPDIFPEAPNRVALTLAGHTHGGQVYIPFIGRPVVPSRYGERYAYGLIEEGGRTLYVTSGVGTAIIPVRFLTPPEIVLMTLTPGGETG
jgi:predicted MPP superfamily phosphohydrolase